MHELRLFGLFVLCLFFNMTTATSQEITWNSYQLETPWEVSAEKDGVRISYCPALSEEEEYRAMKVELKTLSKVDKMLASLQDIEQLESWVANLESAHMVSQDPGNWSMIQKFDFPWPFKNKQALVSYKVTEHTDHYLRIEVTGDAPKPSPHINPDYQNFEPFHALWEYLYISEQQHAIISYQVVSREAPKLPRWIQDPVIQKVIINSFIKLREVLDQPSH